ncbi:MAG: N-acetylmuramoyl-L-alanine amidase [Oscillospiraceae bacterium]|nr:N-acetylmuramoyl-L-alanine amidase [Oscillospiraceae bacterium]
MKSKWSVAFILAVILSFTALIVLVHCKNDLSVNTSSNYTGKHVVIIDAGHGGVDGGAVAVDGSYEKDINLIIAKKLNTFMRAMGFETVMIRTEDISIHDKDADTIRKKKHTDLHNRLKIINETPNSIFVSIHQNHFLSSKTKGTQVYYSPNLLDSKILAQSIQSSVAENLQQNNKRVVKKSGTSIFLLLQAQTPAVMVECGFLSNYEETQLLKDDMYQNQIAFCVMNGIINYFASQQY